MWTKKNNLLQHYSHLNRFCALEKVVAAAAVWSHECRWSNNKIVIGMAIGCLPRVTTQSIRKMHLLRVRKILITCAITWFVHISRQLVVLCIGKNRLICATNTPFENCITWHLLLLLLSLHQMRSLITILANNVWWHLLRNFGKHPKTWKIQISCCEQIKYLRHLVW